MATRAVDPVSNLLLAGAQALASRSAGAIAAATRRASAPEPGQVSLSVVWGVATFAIIVVLALAQIPQLREAFLAALPASGTAIVADLREPSGASTGWTGRELDTLDGVGQADTTGALSGANSAAGNTTGENSPTSGSEDSAAIVSTADGSPEPARAVTNATATAVVAQPTAAPTTAPFLTEATTVLGLIDVVDTVPALAVPPVVASVTAAVTTVTAAVAPSAAPAPVVVTTPIARATAKQKAPSGGTPTKAK
ncbi:MAG: hypothetical protein M3O91_11085 [Chloroflexota bacterium]|nr:hypothetical protein [Chloroflexota bacterium]